MSFVYSCGDVITSRNTFANIYAFEDSPLLIIIYGKHEGILDVSLLSIITISPRLNASIAFFDKVSPFNFIRASDSSIDSGLTI